MTALGKSTHRLGNPHLKYSVMTSSISTYSIHAQGIDPQTILTSLVEFTKVKCQVRASVLELLCSALIFNIILCFICGFRCKITVTVKELKTRIWKNCLELIDVCVIRLLDTSHNGEL